MRHIKKWMCAQGLKWDEDMEMNLSRHGISFVEQFKLLEVDEWNDLFSEATMIMQRHAQVVYKKLSETGRFDPTKCTIQHAIQEDGGAVPPSPSAKKASRTIREESPK